MTTQSYRMFWRDLFLIFSMSTQCAILKALLFFKYNLQISFERITQRYHMNRFDRKYLIWYIVVSNLRPKKKAFGLLLQTHNASFNCQFNSYNSQFESPSKEWLNFYSWQSNEWLHLNLYTIIIIFI
jgi:hypothetical protein